MIEQLEYRMRDRELATTTATLRGQAAELQRAQQQRTGITIAIVVGVLVLMVTQHADGVWIGLIAIIGLIVIFSVARGAGTGRTRRKLGFAADLVDALAPELHPKARTWLRLDLRAYNDEAFLVRSWTSITGKPKRKYRSRWLSLESVLADGTEISIDRTVGAKVKPGGTQKRRKLIIAVEPHPKRYRPIDLAGKDGKALTARMEQVAGAFANRPEEVGVRLKAHAASATRVVVTLVQDDTTFHVAELVAVIEGIVAFLGERRLAAAA